jgi:hypothetical protein
MSGSLPRRRLLSSGAALAATAVLTAPTLKGAIDKSSDPGEAGAGPVLVRWNAQARRWAPRPPHADFGVVFLSTNDPHATPPKDVHVQAGDLWRRHPDAEEAA